MYTPIRWIIQDINENMRSEKVKSKIEKNEDCTMSELCPLLLYILVSLIIICALILIVKYDIIECVSEIICKIEQL